MWGQLGKLVRREGAEPSGSEKFYRVVVQSVLLCGAEPWVLTDTMSQRIDGEHVIFLRQVTRKHATWRRDGYWRQVPEEEVLQVPGTQAIRTYVARRQATVAEWVDNRPIFDVCTKETGFEGGGDSGCHGGGRRQWRTR